MTTKDESLANKLLLYKCQRGRRECRNGVPLIESAEILHVSAIPRILYYICVTLHVLKKSLAIMILKLCLLARIFPGRLSLTPIPSCNLQRTSQPLRLWASFMPGCCYKLLCYVILDASHLRKAYLMLRVINMYFHPAFLKFVFGQVIMPIPPKKTVRVSSKGQPPKSLIKE